MWRDRHAGAAAAVDVPLPAQPPHRTHPLAPTVPHPPSSAWLPRAPQLRLAEAIAEERLGGGAVQQQQPEEEEEGKEGDEG